MSQPHRFLGLAFLMSIVMDSKVFFSCLLSVVYFPCTISTSRVGASVAVIMICATRALLVVFGVAVMVSVAFPVPDSGATVSHDSLLTAFHGVSAVMVTATTPPSAVTPALFCETLHCFIISSVGKCFHSDALEYPFQGGKFK